MPKHQVSDGEIQVSDGEVKLVLESNQKVATFRYFNKCEWTGTGSSWDEALYFLYKKCESQLRINPEIRRYFNDLVKQVCKKADIEVPEYVKEPVFQN